MWEVNFHGTKYKWLPKNTFHTSEDIHCADNNYVTIPAKTRHNSAFSEFHFTTQMCVLAKFQLHILKAFEVIALHTKLLSYKALQ